MDKIIIELPDDFTSLDHDSMAWNQLKGPIEADIEVIAITNRYIDDSGLGLLINAKYQANRGGHSFKLITSEHLARILRVTNIGSYLLAGANVAQPV